MIVDYFTPISGLVGGCIIGSSAGVLLLFNGDILGASGIASSFVVTPRKTLFHPSQQWKLFFVGMFFLTSRIYLIIWPDALYDARLGNSDGIPLVSSPGYLFGGFLVGIGTRLGNGCTTGHGICGMARLSIRSFAGVGSFMLVGVLTATFSSESRFLFDNTMDVEVYLPTQTSVTISSTIGSLIAVAGILGLILRKVPESATESERNELENHKRKILPSIASAFVFSIGLVVSRMTLFSKIYGFLNMKLIPDGTWDPTLLCVMGGGFLVSFLSYQWVQGFNIFTNSQAITCPLSQKAECGKFNVPNNKVIDANLIIGEVLFGIGWGTAGWCPGPAMFLAFVGYPYLLYLWWPMFFVGAIIGEQIKTFQSRLKECRTRPIDDDDGPQKNTNQGVKPEERDECCSNATLVIVNSVHENNEEEAGVYDAMPCKQLI